MRSSQLCTVYLNDNTQNAEWTITFRSYTGECIGKAKKSLFSSVFVAIKYSYYKENTLRGEYNTRMLCSYNIRMK